MNIKAETRDNRSITLPIQSENPQEAISDFFDLLDLNPENVLTLQRV